MAHQAATLEPTCSLYQTPRTIPGVSRLVTTCGTKRRLLFFTCVLVILAAVLVAVVTFSVYFSNRGAEQRGSAEAGSDSFCCPDDAEDVDRFVNATINPCRNFFAHVCTSGDRQGWKQVMRKAELEKIMVTGALPKRLKKGKATEFIITFYMSCLKAIPNRHVFLSSMATKLAANNLNLLRRPNATDALIYTVTASAKYVLHSFLHFKYVPIKSRIFLNLTDRCPNVTFDYELMEVSVNALKNEFDTKITLEDLLRMHNKICRKFHNLSNSETQYSTLNGSDVFDRDVWDLRDLGAALSAIGYSLGNEMEINVVGASKIRVMHGVFSTDEYGGTGAVKGAYLLWHSLASGFEQFYASHDGSWQQVFQTCNQSVKTIREIWDRFTAEILTTPAKDMQAGATFAAVKQAVFWDCRRSSLFEGDDARRLESLFKDFTLVTPTASNAAPIALPKPSPDYTENLLRGRAFNFVAIRARLQGLQATGMLRTYRMDVFSGRYFALPAYFYDVIRPTSPASEIPNMATLGWLLSETMWFVVLHGTQWDDKTRANFQKLRACFVSSYIGSESRPYMTNATVAASLGLSSLLSAFHRSGWDTLRMTSSMVKMSQGQLFYALATYLRCPLKQSPEVVRYVNVPLMYDNDFATVFGCSAHSPMAKHGLCSIHTISRQ